MNNPVGWFEIYVQDMARAKTFYQHMLGVTLTHLESPESELWAFPMEQSASGAAGALVKMPGFNPMGNSVLVYFQCTNCAIEADKAEQAGGVIHRPKTAIGSYGFIALVVDTEGNLVGLHSMQ